MNNSSNLGKKKTKNNNFVVNDENCILDNNDNLNDKENILNNNLMMNEYSDKSDNIDLTDNSLISTSKTSYNKKLEIVKKINKIKKKEYLLNIFKIITTHSDEYTENTNGVFIFFHNLPDEVYEKIENYLNLIYKLHIKSDIKNIFDSEISDYNITETIYNNIEIDKQNKNLTNKEKMILRRKKYEEYLQQNQSL